MMSSQVRKPVHLILVGLPCAQWSDATRRGKLIWRLYGYCGVISSSVAEHGGEVMGLFPDTQNCRLRMRRECRERFPRHQLQRKPQVSDPGMHHDTCVTHLSWYMFPAFPAHAQPATLRIWQEPHATVNGWPFRNLSMIQLITLSVIFISEGNSGHSTLEIPRPLLLIWIK